jgi:WD40 repeat protein
MSTEQLSDGEPLSPAVAVLPKPVILAVYANAEPDTDDYLRDIDLEARDIHVALKRSEALNLCRLVELRGATTDDIFDVFSEPLIRNRVSVLHFAGHSNSYELFLRSMDGFGLTSASGDGLAEFFKAQEGLRVVFLNGCSTRFHVDGLLKVGVHAVIATEKAIDDSVARRFAGRFYSNFGQGAPLATAFSEAVAAVKTEYGPDPEVLYREHGLERWPWEIHYGRGRESIATWSLPQAVGDPLFGLPEPPKAELPPAPFRHLEPYRSIDAELFFGRGTEIRTLYEWATGTDRPPVLLLAGDSGVGKSSLLLAGFAPRLRTAKFLYTRRSSSGLCTTLVHGLAAPAGSRLVEAWRDAEAVRGRTIAVIDQVDEAFTHNGGGTHGEVDEFLNAVAEVFGPTSRHTESRLLVSFRKEYLAEIETGFIDRNVPIEIVLVASLSRSNVLEIVDGTARSSRLREKYSLKIQDGLAERIASQIASDESSNVAPLLQVQLSLMWRKVAPMPPDSRMFSVELYERILGRAKLLGDFLDEQLQHLTVQNREAVESGLHLDVLQFFVTPFITSEIRTTQQIAHVYGDRANTLVDQLVDLYLLLPMERDNRKMIRLSHDVIAPIIRNRFDRSVAPGQLARRVLEARLISDRDHTIPLDDLDLALVERGRSGMMEWDNRQVALVQTSINERDKRGRRRRMAQIAVAFMLILIIVSAGVAFWQSVEAASQRDEARIRFLAELALRQASAGGDDQGAFFLAEEAYELSNQHAGKAMSQVADTFRQLLSKRFLSTRTDLPTSALSIASNRINGNVVVVGKDSLSLFNVRTRSFRPLPLLENEEPAAACFDPKGTTIASVGRGQVIVRSGSILEPKLLFSDDDLSFTSVSFSNDGRLLLVGDDKGVLRAWDFSVNQRLAEVDLHVSVIRKVIPSASQTGFFVGSSEGIFSWSPSDGRKSICHADGEDVISLTFDDRSQEILIGTVSGLVASCAAEGPDNRFREIGKRRPSSATGVYSAGSNVLVATRSHGVSLILRSADAGEPDVTIRGGSANETTLVPTEHALVFTDSDSAHVVDLEDKFRPTRAILLRDPPDAGAATTISYLGFSEAGKYLSIGMLQQLESTARRWNITTAPPNEVDRFAQPAHVMGGAISPDAKTLATVDPYSEVRLWRFGETAATVLRAPTTGAGWSIAFDQAGRSLAVAVDNSKIELIDIAEKSNRLIGQHHPNTVARAVAFSPFDDDVISGGDDKSLRFWRQDGTGPSRRAIEFDAPILSLAVSSAAKQVVVASGMQLYLFTTGSFSSVRKLSARDIGTILSVSFAPDGRTVAAGDSNGKVFVWNLQFEESEAQVFGNGQLSAYRSVALDGFGSVAAGDVHGRVSIITIDPQALARQGCIFLGGSIADIRSWSDRAVGLADTSFFVPICGDRPKARTGGRAPGSPGSRQHR